MEERKETEKGWVNITGIFGFPKWDDENKRFITSAEEKHENYLV